tara:strand:- start:236 stop:529 length:294 start_codon:yes stop_codon:yes gene_type:complete
MQANKKMAKKQKQKKADKNPWENIDREVVTALTNEFKAIHTIYKSQDVDPLAIASALLAAGQWAMYKELGLKETQDLLQLLGNFKYEEIPHKNRTLN